MFDSQGTPDVRDLMWSTLLWLDYPQAVVVSKAVLCSLRRIVTRAELCHGYRDSLREWRRPDHPARKAIALHSTRRRELAERIQDPRYWHVTVIRFVTLAVTERWVRSLTG